MKKFPLSSVVLMSAALMFANPILHAATQTFEGTLSDSMCEKKHMMPGKSDAQCIAECLKSGSKFVLVANDKVYLLTAKKDLLAPLAGKHVKVQGELKNNAIAVAAIQ